VHRCNAQGLAGLCDRRHAGPTPRLTPEQLAELEKVVEQGPDPARDGVVRWRRVDLRALIKARFEVERHERRDRHAAAPARLRPPVGPARAPVEPARGARGVQKGLAALVREALPGHARSQPVEIWFQDGGTRRVPPRGSADPQRGSSDAKRGRQEPAEGARSAPGWCCLSPTRKRCARICRKSAGR
jgi:hypothetical protein